MTHSLKTNDEITNNYSGTYPRISYARRRV